MRQALAEYREKRESRRLSEKGDASLVELEELLVREEGGADVDEARIYREFGECRFAYEQALEIAPDNQRARDGLQQALESMARRELDNGAHKAASLLIADLPRANAELASDLEELASRLESREREFEDLQKIKHEKDTEVGRASRSIFAMVTGVVWAVLTFGIQLLIEADLLSFDHEFVLLHIVGLIAILLLIFWIGRERLFQNEANKRILWSVLAMFLVAGMMRVSVWAAQVPSDIGLALELIMYGAAGSAVAVAIDLRILWASIPFAIAGVVAAAFPELVFTVFGVTNIVGMGSLGIAWWPRGPEC